ncbi:CaiB/BaiF CoA transferase family protein [Sphingoaurantiacus capsulatus]|uniref:CaiB/BaiF CoA transferase family protein n=1 Tax=Sphingoaurantiacus capsulatus TaxID=1771310 RepID=A0ABV7XAF4_9SPHN
MNDNHSPAGPLVGVRVLELAGLGPTPFAAMMLADLGASVLRIDRTGGPAVSAGDSRLDTLNRSRPSLALDLKSPEAMATIAALVARADVLIEGYRPGVAERLGLGPDALHAINQRLVYARMTGWGQTGPLALKAGHDINYLALTGGLHMIGPGDRPPPPPLNLVGDFGGGGMFAVTGILAALVERATSGKGQVIDCAMVDGATTLLAQAYAWRDMNFWTDDRGENLLDGGAYFYRCYETADGGYLAVGAIEPQFHSAFIEGLGLDPADFDGQMDRRHWAARAARIAEVVRSRTRDDWVAAFDPFDACVSPVLTPAEAPAYHANAARDVFIGGAPAAAPRFDRTPGRTGKPTLSGEGGANALGEWGVD